MPTTAKRPAELKQYLSDAQTCFNVLKKDPLNLNAEQARMHDVHDPFFWECVQRCYSYTLIGTERMYNLYSATEYIVRRNVAGDFVECGVFLGGAILLAALKLRQLGDLDRRILLYDTFAGFTGDITDDDYDFCGKIIGGSLFNNFVELTKRNVLQSGYPESRFQFFVGDVFETLPENDSQRIALLRLDTDTYTSTLAELEHLYPKVSVGGLVIIDDYGFSRGVRKAVDEYFGKQDRSVFLQRPDFTSRTAVKL